MSATTPMRLELELAMTWLSQCRGVDIPGVVVDRVHTDSRSLKLGDLFVALRGERFDGNQFIAQAKSQGAVAVVCEPSGEAEAKANGLPALVVADARMALGELSAGWRAQFELPVIAVTGSNGKTTVTQMVAAILRAYAGDDALSTQGNFNNDIGVPLTLLNLRAHHRVAVVEMGMNHPGEIAYLSKLVQPTVALVNNAQREHQEFMGTVEAVARENGAVLQALPDQGVAVFASDDLYTTLWQRMAGSRVQRSFAVTAIATEHADENVAADVRAAVVVWQSGAWQFTLKTPEGTAPVHLHIAGRHNVKNALAASACALAAGLPLTAVAQGLIAFEPVKGRSRAVVLHTWGADITLVDDTYNANPDSVRAAIDVLAELPAPRLLVLGDMGEVGNQGPEFHAEVGAYAVECGLDALYTLGELSAHAASAFGTTQHFGDMDSLLATITSQMGTFQSVVVKGSRFMKMERVVDALLQVSEAAHTSQKNQKGEAHAA